MKIWRTFGIVFLLLTILGLAWLIWKNGEPRRQALHTLGHLDTALRTGNSTDLLGAISTPAAIQGRTTAEQAQFLSKALVDEISPEGLATLQRAGTFGPLADLFPAEAKNWAELAGVKVEDCVAFKMERSGIRAEVVLVRDGEIYRVVRCNNVKQMADQRKRT